VDNDETCSAPPLYSCSSVLITQSIMGLVSVRMPVSWVPLGSYQRVVFPPSSLERSAQVSPWRGLTRASLAEMVIRVGGGVVGCVVGCVWWVGWSWAV